MKRRSGIDRALRELVAKRDDRLLRDIGLSRQDLIGPERSYWLGWNARQSFWQL